MDTSKYNDATAMKFFLIIPAIQLLIWGVSFYMGGQVWDTPAPEAPAAEAAPADAPAE